MRVCIFGAGSLGSALGGMLARSNQVTLVGRRAHVAAIRKHGLALVGDVRRTVNVEAHQKPEGLDPPELLIVTTKAYDTEDAVQACRTLASRNTMVLTLQNGLGNLELLRTWKGSNAFGGTTTLGANLVAPGKIRISGLGETVIGSDLNPEGAKKICRLFRESGLAVQIQSDVDAAIWTKVAVSASINPLTAVLRIENGALLLSRPISRMMLEVCREAVSIGVANGVSLSFPAVMKSVRAVAKNTSGNRSSMLQDVERGKRTEIGQINGAIWNLGDRLGSPAPLNKALWAMISSFEREATSQKA
ncbi:MAG: hypothetical protein A3K60_07035 [Euryarchaeota archaeon RBG_19FT_COMBO_56_21]|nr:MAG: hypothetical protein A3K60_07035 [Euryarchaeota archaeon RBG_19FT_COMBO_56_21]